MSVRSGSIVPFTQISDFLASRPTPLVFTNGCFDVLHVGHIACLHQARELGAALWVGLNSDASVRRLKGDSRPVFGQVDRAVMLGALRYVDFVTIFDEDTPIRLIEAVRPDILVKGGDWAPEQIVGANLVRSYGGSVQSLPYIEGYSTTGVLQRSQDRSIHESSS